MPDRTVCLRLHPEAVVLPHTSPWTAAVAAASSGCDPQLYHSDPSEQDTAAYADVPAVQESELVTAWEQECYDLTESVLERDPYALECLPAHLASAVELRKKNELFLRGHMCALGTATVKLHDPTNTLILALP